MSSGKQYQAWLSTPEGNVKIGPPTTSEATAWQEIHTEGMLCFPTDPAMRRLLESKCKVGVVVPIHGA